MAIITGDAGDNRLIGTAAASIGIWRLDVGLGGRPANNNAYGASFSPDGSKVGFYSHASNLVAGDTNGASDAFVVDLGTGQVARLVPQVAAPGSVAALWGNLQLLRNFTFSADGTKVAFLADDAAGVVGGDGNGRIDVFWADLNSREVRLVSRGVAGAGANGDSYFPDISADGTRVLWTSQASNLVPGDTNRSPDMFLWDAASGATTLVSTSAGGDLGNRGSAHGVLSPDGRSVLFQGSASNLVAGDSNGRQDIFIKDLASGAVSRVSLAADGGQLDDDSTHPDFSADGQWVIYQTGAAVLAADTNGCVDIYARNLASGETRLLSVDSAGRIGFGGDSTHASFSADMTRMVFQTDVAFSPLDTNDNTDVYVKNLLTGALTLVSVTAGGTAGSGNSNHPVFSPDGVEVVFVSNATDLAAGNTPNRYGIYVTAAPTDGRDSIGGGAGDDTILGLSGDDSITAGGGANSIDAGAGDDTVLAGHGDDTILGGAGDDSILAGHGANRIDAGDGDDAIQAGDGNDTILGRAGDDIILLGNGADSVDGGDGTDLLSFAALADAVRINLAAPRALAQHGATADTVTGVENLLGSGYADTLFGDAGGNWLEGGAGADWLSGGEGADTLLGGTGADKLYGGAGADVFLFRAAADSPADPALRDRLWDFASAEGDRIDLHLLGGGITLAAGFTGTALQLVQRVTPTGTLVSVDIDGDRLADFALLVTGTAYLGASDFILA